MCPIDDFVVLSQSVNNIVEPLNVGIQIPRDFSHTNKIAIFLLKHRGQIILINSLAKLNVEQKQTLSFQNASRGNSFYELRQFPRSHSLWLRGKVLE